MLTQILLLLASTATDLLTVALLARFALQVVRAPFRNPLGQFLLAATNWMVVPTRRLVPSIGAYDTATLLLALQILLIVLAGVRAGILPLLYS
jgi:YggT family protein